MHRLHREQPAAGGCVADQVHQDEVSGAQHVGAGVEVLWGDDVRRRIAAAEVPKRRPVGVTERVTTAAQNIASLMAALPEELWWVFGVGYLGYTGARSFDKRRRVTR